MQWVSASNPVAAVTRGGIDTVSSGSRIAALAIKYGLKMTVLRPVASSVRTPDRPTSLPVPAVVGTLMMGGTFAGHPWHTKVPVKNLEPKHPLNAAFDGMDCEINDEIYQFRADTALPTERKFLLALDTTKMDVSKGNRTDG